MKNFKQLMGALCVVCMIMVTAVPAFAVSFESDTLPPPTLITHKDIHPDTDNPVMASALASNVISCFIPYNNGSGTSGSIATVFTAEIGISIVLYYESIN